jgi:hypothetical protein
MTVLAICASMYRVRAYRRISVNSILDAQKVGR